MAQKLGDQCIVGRQPKSLHLSLRLLRLCFWGTDRAQEFRLVHLQKLCVSFLLLVKAFPYTVRTSDSTYDRKHNFL